ncbi:DoxX family protein [Candidatus Nomurabacteria bacterium RIFCSPLOWO2_12_FULL_46_14]|uniref:DoxX family protein n=1 Tax=Candidatus Nomurabacteria bacterium RIFCSPLOWO2_12_FULL_46_14 TaxID=1801797 RepID=A0A1F6YC37_9BACT|nr:MAG: DoxX family protein [Candidatus Nomurabacteria bacterium RIFCSPLOWO2_12_FULL_46_14]
MIYLFLLGRILLGGYFIKNSFNHFLNLSSVAGYAASKNTPWPKLAVTVTGLILLLGGLGILLGVYIDYAVLLLSVFLIGVTFKMHQYWKESEPMQRMAENINFYKNLALLGAILIMLFIPEPWEMSLF